ncbi:MAG: NUDIX hydrolase [Myxococcota bacterium]|nr:NUDIX hydrolase [Myxococcota bacterium]
MDFVNPGRESLQALLQQHSASDPAEARDLERMREAVRSLQEPFSRGQPQAHFTGSAVIVDPQGARVCLIHHGKLHRWLQPGGHCEPEDDGSLEAAALREAREETGLNVRLHPGAPRPLDVDAHLIPARGSEPDHHHLDIRFLLVAEDPQILTHDPQESHGARWLGWEEALALSTEPALLRLFRKARAIAERGEWANATGGVGPT